jgi:PEP-CTERM motif-containing protein
MDGRLRLLHRTLTTLNEVDRGANAIAFAFDGTLTGGPFTNLPVNLVLSLTQAGGPGNVVSASLTNASVIPEPSTWAMMGLGFTGLHYVATRRRAKDRKALAI